MTVPALRPEAGAQKVAGYGNLRSSPVSMRSTGGTGSLEPVPSPA